MAVLAENRYGKSGVRLVKLTREGGRHHFKDLAVAVSLEGDFRAVHESGDNANVLPTDTMKNTVYALARQNPLGEIEEFGKLLAAHFLRSHAAIRRARVTIRESLWERLEIAGAPDPHTFRKAGGESRLTEVVAGDGALAIESGLEDMLVAKTSKSAFDGFFRDRYTTLQETRDRILATAVRAVWKYSVSDLDFGSAWRGIRQTLLETLAAHDSESVQHTLHAMGEKALQRHPEIGEIQITMPNKHHLLVDLSRIGLDNPNEIFVPIEEPYGLIQATLRR
ncbi:MAG: factor-independent urate hydroxylase [Thermoanaerobaculia bacterium]